MRKLNIRAVMIDGSVLEAETRATDYVAYEAESRKRGWGSISDSPSSWEAFVSYRALVRTRAISLPFDKFLAEVDELDATPVPEADPFPKDLSGDSSSS